MTNGIVFMKLKINLFILWTFCSLSANAADIRGQLTGLTGASIVAYCGKIQKSTTISKSGGFYIGHLPVNKSCQFKVVQGDASSVGKSFKTNGAVTEFRGSLRKVGKKIIVIRK